MIRMASWCMRISLLFSSWGEWNEKSYLKKVHKRIENLLEFVIKTVKAFISDSTKIVAKESPFFYFSYSLSLSYLKYSFFNHFHFFQRGERLKSTFLLVYLWICCFVNLRLRMTTSFSLASKLANLLQVPFLTYSFDIWWTKVVYGVVWIKSIQASSLLGKHHFGLTMVKRKLL